MTRPSGDHEPVDEGYGCETRRMVLSPLRLTIHNRPPGLRAELRLTHCRAMKQVGLKSRIQPTPRQWDCRSDSSERPRVEFMEHEPYQDLHPEVPCPTCDGVGFF